MGKKKDPRAGQMRKRAHAGTSGKEWWRKLTLPRRGKKETRMVPGALSAEQQAKLEKRQDKYYKAISAPRTIKAKALSIADWNADTGRAHITQQRGNVLKSMGDFRSGQQYLYPEEALWLVDKGVLELRYGGRPCSLQMAWALCFGAADALRPNEYLAYAHLRRAGYVVRRAEVDKVGDFGVQLSCWRVCAWKRKETPRALFHVCTYGLGERPPMVKDVAALAAQEGKARIKLALIDRSTVIIADVSCNATPLSERFTKKLYDGDGEEDGDEEAIGEEGD